MTPDSLSRRSRAVRFTLRLGVMMLSCGAQVREAEAAMRGLLQRFGLFDAEAIISSSTVSVSDLSRGDGETATAIGAARDGAPDLGRLAAAAELAAAVSNGRTGLAEAEGELAGIGESSNPYHRLLLFASPAFLSFAVTIMFHGSLADALATLVIGMAVQPGIDWIARSELPAFFQTAFGVMATTMLVVVLVKAGVPIAGSLVLTGSLLRFLPGAALVSGMNDLIAGAHLSGVARLAQVLLLGAAVAGGTSVVLALGQGVGVHMLIGGQGEARWHPAVIVAAGTGAIAFNAIRLCAPPRRLVSILALGAVAVVIGQGLTLPFQSLDAGARTLLAALVIGAAGATLGHWRGAPAAIWTMPAILPLLPAPTTLLPFLASSNDVRESLQGQAAGTAFGIGVGVALGSIAVTTLQRSRDRVREVARRRAPRTDR